MLEVSVVELSAGKLVVEIILEVTVGGFSVVVLSVEILVEFIAEAVVGGFSAEELFEDATIEEWGNEDVSYASLGDA